jgi:hypothetical protein
MADRIDIWLSDKKQPVRKTTKNGTPILEFYGTWQSEAYDAWAGHGKQGEAPSRYVYVNVTVFDAGLMEHVEKIYAKAMSLAGADPRPTAHLIGKWREGGPRTVDGKQYADFTANEASPLVFGPLKKS